MALKLMICTCLCFVDIPLYSTPLFRCKVRHPFRWKGRHLFRFKVPHFDDGVILVSD